MSEQNAAPICVEYTPTFRDYLGLTILVVWRRLKWLAALAALNLVMGLLVLLRAPLREATAEGGLTAYAFLFFLPVMVFVVVPALVFFSAQNHWRTVEALRLPKVHEFSDSGIAVGSATASGRVGWANIARADLTRGPIILTYTQPIYVFLPVSAFPDPDVRTALLELLRTKVPLCRGF